MAIMPVVFISTSRMSFGRSESKKFSTAMNTAMEHEATTEYTGMPRVEVCLKMVWASPRLASENSMREAV